VERALGGSAGLDHLSDELGEKLDMTGALISCVVPVYNGERFLGEALESILAQTYRAVEIIAVDDGSTDGTRTLLESYGDRVRYVSQTNSGPATTRNTGIGAARGKFIAFLDSDDLWHPEKLARQMARFEARPELGLCLTQIQNFWMPEVSREEAAFRDHPRSRAIDGFTSVTLLARRSVFEAIGVFDTSLKHGDDTDWFLRAESHGIPLEIVPEVLVRRRLHANNRSRRWATRSREEYLMMMKALVDRRRAAS
jgi:glycosyltransferase involved in cell wall biosynthesis